MKGELGWLTHPYGKGVSKLPGLRVGRGLWVPGEMEDGNLDQTQQLSQLSNCYCIGLSKRPRPRQIGAGQDGTLGGFSGVTAEDPSLIGCYRKGLVMLCLPLGREGLKAALSWRSKPRR